MSFRSLFLVDMLPLELSRWVPIRLARRSLHIRAIGLAALMLREPDYFTAAIN